MARASNGYGKAPRGAVLVADFTDGSIPSAQITFDAGSPSATGRSYTYDSNGVKMSITGGTTAQYASMRYEPGGTIDLSGSDWFAVEVDCPEGTGMTLNGITAFICNDAGSTYTNYFNRSLSSGTGKTPLRGLYISRRSADTWTSTGSPNWATVRRIEFRMLVQASVQNQPAHVFIRKIWTGTYRPKIMLSFDDLMDGAYDYALPSLEAANMKASLFCTPWAVGGAGRMTQAQMQEIYDAGWDFGVQQYDDTDDIPVNFAGIAGLTSNGAGTATFANVSNIPHLLKDGQEITISGAMSANFNLTTTITLLNDYSFTYPISGAPTTPDLGWATCPRLTQQEAMLAFQRTIDWLQARNWTRGNEIAAYSSGVTNEWVESWMPSLGFVIGRTTRINTSPWRGMDMRSSDPKALLRFPGQTMDQQTSTTILGYVDACIKYGTSLMLYGHDINPTPAALTITESEWDAIVAGLKARRDQGLVDVITPSEFYREIFGGRARAS